MKSGKLNSKQAGCGKFLFLFLISFLAGCCQPLCQAPPQLDPTLTVSSTPKGIIFYFISAPINDVRAEEAIDILGGISGVGRDDVRLVYAGNIFRIIELCPFDSFIVPNVTLQDDKPESARSLVTTAIQSLDEILTSSKPDKEKKKCSPNFVTSIKIATNLTDAAGNSKDSIVIIWQVPWNVSQASEGDRKKLKEQIDVLAQFDNIKSVIIFGVDPDQSDKIAMPFKALQDKGKFDIGTDSFQTLEQIKALRTRLLKN